MSKIHQTAIIHKDVKIGENVEVGPYSIINSKDVVLEDDVIIKSHVYIEGDVRIGKGSCVWPFASIGTVAQHINHNNEICHIEIGEYCQIREYVTINSPMGDNCKMTIGNKCFIMAYSHIAHNCNLGEGVIMANGATLGGYVQVGKYSFIGGLSAVHQHVRIGDYAMIGGGSMIGQDVLPYCLGIGYPLKITGLNVVGLKRHKFSFEERKSLIKIFRLTFQSHLTWEEAKESVRQQIDINSHIQNWIDFCDHLSKRGFVTYRGRKKDVESYQEVLSI